MKKNICFDFDDVVCDGQTPMEGAERSLIKLINMGYKVTILSSNNSEYIRQWIENNMPTLYIFYRNRNLTITNIKPVAIAYVDDKAIKFTSWQEVMTNFKPL